MSSEQLLIKTDSQYSMKCFVEWLPNWKERGFKSVSGEPIKNRPLILYLSSLLDQRTRNGQTVRLQYVKGHAGHEGNEGADVLANRGCRLPDQPERDWDALRANVQQDLFLFVSESTAVNTPSGLSAVASGGTNSQPIPDISPDEAEVRLFELASMSPYSSHLIYRSMQRVSCQMRSSCCKTLIEAFRSTSQVPEEKPSRNERSI